MVAARLAAAQAALGCQPRILSYRFPGADERIAASLSTIPNFSAVALEYLPPLTRTERFVARGARRRIESITDQVDFLHLHGVWDPVIHAAGSMAKKCGRPFALTPHGMLDPWAMSQKSWKKRTAMILGYRRMLNNAGFLHFLNAEELALAQNLRLTSPAKIVPNGIFLEEIDPLPDRGQFRGQHPELGGSKMVFFLSRLHFKKGLDILADAFAIVSREFPEARLVVAGPDDGARSDFESQIARLGITSRVHVVGPIYGSQKFAALRDCDCFCLPSRQEGFSLAILEAMACEAPVVITPGCHFPEVKEAGAGIIAELDAKAIAEGISSVLRDPAAASQMGQNARQLIVERFTWPQAAKQLISGYREVLGT